MDEKVLVKLPFYAKLALVLLSISLIVLFMHEGRTLIIPLFFSTLLAMLLLPAVKWLQKMGLGKSFSAIISLFLFIGFIFLLLFFLGKQIASFSQDLPALEDRMNAWILELERWIDQQFAIAPNEQVGYLKKAGDDITRAVTIVLQNIFMTTGGLLIWTIFVFIFTYFMLSYRSLIRRFFLMLFDSKHHDRVTEVLDETRTLVNGYLLGLLTEMMIIAFLSSVAFLIFGINYAVMLGVICGLLNIIPYIGIYTAISIGAIITLSNNTPVHALYLIAISLVIHFIDANIILPRIVGGRVKINPLITIIVVIIGSMLWGIAGMFLFIPLAAILKIIFSKVDDLKPWAILMGTEKDIKDSPKQSN